MSGEQVVIKNPFKSWHEVEEYRKTHNGELPTEDKYILCPTCNQGHIEKPIDRQSKWHKGCGDKDLWAKYSHVLKKQKDGTYSQPIKIASFYRYYKENNKQIYSINLSGYDKKGFANGSYPIIDKEKLNSEFKFISRETGKINDFFTNKP